MVTGCICLGNPVYKSINPTLYIKYLFNAIPIIIFMILICELFVGGKLMLDFFLIIIVIHLPTWTTLKANSFGYRNVRLYTHVVRLLQPRVSLCR